MGGSVVVVEGGVVAVPLAAVVAAGSWLEPVLLPAFALAAKSA
jgi:hypothetical protein